MPGSQKIKNLMEDKDLDGLVKILRNPADPGLRSEAAAALASLEDMEAVEPLIRATLQDPDASVQNAARTSLEALVGSQASLAISAYRSGPPDPDPWLMERFGSPDRPGNGPDKTPESPDFKLRYMKFQRDMYGLVSLLRSPADPVLRIRSAQALGELGDLEATEFLARSYLQDPDLEVREAARLALHDLVGSQADFAISSYRNGPQDSDAWLQDVSLSVGEDGEFEDETEWEEVEGVEEPSDLAETDPEQPLGLPAANPAQSRWDEENLPGLIAVLTHESDPAMRMRAIRALKRSSDMRAIAALAQTSLWGDDESVRQAARQALEDRFGDDSADIIESYREGGPELEDLSEEEDEQEEGASAAGPGLAYPEPLQASPPSSYAEHQPVIQEASLPWGLIGMVGLGIIIVAVVLLFLITRQ
jgi:HEAT repeat protein